MASGARRPGTGRAGRAPPTRSCPLTLLRRNPVLSVVRMVTTFSEIEKTCSEAGRLDEVHVHPPDAQPSVQPGAGHRVGHRDGRGGGRGGGVRRVRVHRPPGAHAAVAGVGRPRRAGPVRGDGYAAAQTTTLRLIPNIVVLPYRNPFVVAKAGATLDLLPAGGSRSASASATQARVRRAGRGLRRARRAVRRSAGGDPRRSGPPTTSPRGQALHAKGITAHPGR